MKNLVIVFLAAVMSFANLQAGVSLASIDAPALPALTEQSQLPQLETFPMSKRQVKKNLKNGNQAEVTATAKEYAATVKDWNNNSLSSYTNYWAKRTATAGEIYEDWKSGLNGHNDELLTARAVEAKAVSMAKYLETIELLIDQDLHNLASTQEQALVEAIEVIGATDTANPLKAAAQTLANSKQDIVALKGIVQAAKANVETDIAMAEQQIWMGFQEALYTALITDKLIHNPSKFQIAVVEESIEVNGKQMAPSTFSKYQRLFADFNQEVATGWQYKVNGNRAFHGTADNLTVEVFNLDAKDLTLN